MLTGGYFKLRLAVAALAGALLMTPAAAATLITEHEAELPADNSLLRSGIERGPDIIVVYPPPKTGMIQSPFAFKVKFEPHGGTQIDLDTLTVVYKRIPAIDLTARLKPYVRPDGIDMPSAEVPAGDHRIMIFVKDSAGHQGQADIHFDVEK
ncbi:MAG: hypothetical protein WB760_04600 [Xanthobacteraceae bacterium]